MAPDIQQRLNTLLQSNLDRGTLLREISTLAQESAFPSLADQWAPALYARGARFFESFLLRHLQPRPHNTTIRALLLRAERDGHTTLFQGLYRSVMSEDEWNKDLLALAQSSAPDEHVVSAIQRRAMHTRWFVLTEATAVAVYRRNPQLLSSFVQAHIHRRWGMKHIYAKLWAEAHKNGDDDLYWYIFRTLASKEEWSAELRRLLKRTIPAHQPPHQPPHQIVAELQKRHLLWSWEMDPDVLTEFVEAYGAAVIPYIERNISSIRGRTNIPRFLAAVARIGDEAMYWRMFFKVGRPAEWNDALRTLLKQPLSDQELFTAIQRRTPPDALSWSWQYDNDVALTLYQRNAALFRPLLERFVQRPELPLFREAERNGDEAFLDVLTFRMIQQMQSLLYTRQDDKKQAYQEHITALRSRFERLYTQSPMVYVHHAAHILSHFNAYSIWSLRQSLTHNPMLAYLVQQHRDVWLQSPDSIRELLESPTIHMQRVGVDMLCTGGHDAAQRVLENLPTLRALLLGKAKINTKKRVLKSLELAAQQSAECAARVLPVLEETMDFRSKRAIDERIMVSFVRLRRQMGVTKAGT